MKQIILGGGTQSNLGEEKRMKKKILVIIAAMLTLFTVSLACLILHTQSTYAMHEALEIPGHNQQATNAETTENGEKPEESERTNTSHNQNCNINDAEEVEKMQDITSNEFFEGSAETSQDESAWTDTCPPDGRVYWTPEPPYAYTPTYTPKKWWNITINFNLTSLSP
ncbi:MAG: hypothetical protein U9O89_04270 [Thermoproteota archaeon]|nr:hypothetical protein [Thermoproteota archaeon]